MTLLQFIRQPVFNLSNNQIRDVLDDSQLPNGWSATMVQRFISQCPYDSLVDSLNDSYYDLRDCHDCGDAMFDDDSYSCYEGDFTVCNSCSDDHYYYSENRDTYIANEDYDEYDSDYDDEGYSGVHRYETNVLDHLDFQLTASEQQQQNKGKKLLYCGVELEVERRNNCPDDIAHHINTSVLPDFAICKSDGSLDNGFEIVTAPSTYAMHKKNWSKFFDDEQCRENLKGWSTDTAGLHIHLSRNALTPSEIGKILIFINDQTNNDFINQIAGRSSDQWAKKSPKKITDAYNYSDKYEAVNTSHRNTIELRIFRSNVSKHGFFRVLEFAFALSDFVKTTSIALTSLHYTAFFRFMSRPENKATYPNLSAWLIRKGYIHGKPSRTISEQEELTNTATN